MRMILSNIGGAVMGLKENKEISDMFNIWKIFIVLNVFVLQCCGSKQRFCRDLNNDFYADGLVENIPETYLEECPLSSSKFAVYSVVSTSNFSDVQSSPCKLFIVRTRA